MRRRVEIIVFEQERIVKYARPTSHIGPCPVCGIIGPCPVCGINSELLTTAQAAVVSKVGSQSIRRWLAQGKAHSVKTAGGQHRVCRESLLSKGSVKRFYGGGR